MQFPPALRNPSQRQSPGLAAECQMQICGPGGGKQGPALARCRPQAQRSQFDGTESEDVVALELSGHLLTHRLAMMMSSSALLLKRPNTSKPNAPGNACVAHGYGLCTKMPHVWHTPQPSQHSIYTNMVGCIERLASCHWPVELWSPALQSCCLCTGLHVPLWLCLTLCVHAIGQLMGKWTCLGIARHLLPSIPCPWLALAVEGPLYQQLSRSAKLP